MLVFIQKADFKLTDADADADSEPGKLQDKLKDIRMLVTRQNNHSGDARTLIFISTIR